jgi:hypothetical protein
MKYIKYQGGGGFNTFSGYSRAVPEQPVTSQAKAQQEQSGPKLLDDKLYGELIKGGLISDVNVFVDQLIELENSASSSLNVGKSFTGASLKLIAKVNEVRRNKELYKESANTAFRNKSLNEVAVGSYGEVFVRTEKGIRPISVTEYSGKKDKYGQTLTVRELLEEREKNPNLA